MTEDDGYSDKEVDGIVSTALVIQHSRLAGLTFAVSGFALWLGWALQNLDVSRVLFFGCTLVLFLAGGFFRFVLPPWILRQADDLEVSEP